MKEDTAYSVMGMTPEQGRMILHDDKLLIRAQKVEYRRGDTPVGIGLSEDWKYRERVEPVLDHGRMVIVNYLKNYYEGGERRIKTMSVDEYEERMAAVEPETEEQWELMTYSPQPLRGVQLADDIYIRFQDNRIDMRICSLMRDLESRYRIALESCVELIEAGVFRYEARSLEPEPRSRVETMRYRLKRWGKVAEYEHDILFSGELGAAVYRDLKEYAESKPGEMGVYAEKGTIYLQGVKRWKGQTGAACKYYDIGKREGTPDAGRFKLETTLLGPYFKREGIGIEDMLEADRIQELVSPYLTKIVGRYLGRVRPETMRMIQAELGLDEKAKVSDIVRETFKPERTLTQRVAMVERKQAELERRVAALERKK